MRSCFCLAAALSLVAAAGCGGKPDAPASISGKVTYNNAPLTGGTITFQPKEGVPFGRPIEADGTYTMSDITPGDYSVVIETESINPAKPKKTYSGAGQVASTGGSSPPTGPSQATPPTYVKIDTKYGDAKSSGLTVTVTAGGKQTKDFPLTGS